MLQTLSADGNSNTITTNSQVHVHLSGTFGTGTAKLQFKDSGGTWRDINGASWTAATDTLVELAEQTQYQLRINLAGSTSPSLIVILLG